MASKDLLAHDVVQPRVIVASENITLTKRARGSKDIRRHLADLIPGRWPRHEEACGNYTESYRMRCPATGRRVEFASGNASATLPKCSDASPHACSSCPGSIAGVLKQISEQVPGDSLLVDDQTVLVHRRGEFSIPESLDSACAQIA